MEFFVGDVSQLKDIEVFVNAANGIGVMGKGIAGFLAKSGGKQLTEEAWEVCKDHDYNPGEVYVTGSGLMKRVGIERIYHAVTMKFPGGHTSIDIVVRATRNAIEKAVANKVKSIVFPGLGTGVGRLDKFQVAQRMCSVLQDYDHRIRIIVADKDKDFVEAFKKSVKSEKVITYDPHSKIERTSVGA